MLKRNEEKGRDFTVVTQSLDDINKLYPRHFRSAEHKYKSNNWLKMHGFPMRRKPFKKEYMMLDECHMVFSTPNHIEN